MIKNLKLNIKNAQLAEALQQKETGASNKSKAHFARPSAESSVEEQQRPKAQIIRKARNEGGGEEEAPAKRARIIRDHPKDAPEAEPSAAVKEELLLGVQEPVESRGEKPDMSQTPSPEPAAAPEATPADLGSAMRAVEGGAAELVKDTAMSATPAPAPTVEPLRHTQSTAAPRMATGSPLPPQPRAARPSPSSGRGYFAGSSSRPPAGYQGYPRQREPGRYEPAAGASRYPSSRPTGERPVGYRGETPRPLPGATPTGERAPGARLTTGGPRPLGGTRPPLKLRESFSDRQARITREQQERFQQSQSALGEVRPRLGPTGKHFRDLVPPTPASTDQPVRHTDQEKAARAAAHQQRRKELSPGTTSDVEERAASTGGERTRTFDRSKPSKAIKKTADRVRIDTTRIDEDAPWRKKRPLKKGRTAGEDLTIRPSSLNIRLPVMIKDLAQEMKLKASQLISKLFLQGMAVTLNDLLDDETTVQLLGQEFGCEITIDRREDERIRITSQNVQEEIEAASERGTLITRPPVVAFMGHVDHGKTSLIDAIRKSNRVAGEAGAITQHIGAFSCHTAQGDLTVLDTPGHEAFAAMRERGARVTDVIVLVVAGDEGIKPQTDEAIKHARSVNATILVAINKCDKPTFNAETVYRQLAERDLLPEAWGGKIITVNCSAVTGQGIEELLEMIAIQAEVLELRADPSSRARGSVIEAELHKGMGNVATILVLNGTLRHGDALVFSQSWGRVKTMRDEFGKTVDSAGPSHAVRITGLSSLPEAGEEFIVVANEREAREIAEARAEQIREKQVQHRKKFSLEALLQQSQQTSKKTLNCILRADVQGSEEALRFELMKIRSEKVEIQIISEGIGEISESDIGLAAASGAVIIGFHTGVEAHAEELIKQRHVKVRCYDVIYHCVDGVKELMAEQLDKIAEEHARGKAQVKAIFKSSQLGKIAGCQATEGTIQRSYRMRVVRAGKVIWDGPIASLRRGKDDVREVAKGFECGILLQGFSDFEVDDLLESYEIVYRTQSL